MNGIVKNVVGGRSFGFIRADGSGVEYFFHRDDFAGHWKDLIEDFDHKLNISVEFTVVESPKGPRAANVKRVDFPNAG